MKKTPHREPRMLLSNWLSRTVCSSILGWVIIGFGTTALAEELLTEFKGTGNKVTDEFEIDGPWLLDWHVTSEYAESLGIEVNLVDAVFLSYQGLVFISRHAGGGTKLFNDSGRFRFKIMASTSNWRLRVSKISEAEAERMIRIKK